MYYDYNNMYENNNTNKTHVISEIKQKYHFNFDIFGNIKHLINFFFFELYQTSVCLFGFLSNINLFY